MTDVHRYLSAMAMKLPPEALEMSEPQQYLNECHQYRSEPIQPPVGLGRIDDLINELQGTQGRYDPAMDALLCVPLHENLQLTRRQAADPKLWAWMAIARYADFVAYRWAPGAKNGVRAAERFAGNRVRQTFARLWWVAELTWSEQSGYEDTKRLLSLRGFQDLNEAVFGRAFCAYPPALKAFIDVVGNQRENVIRETAKEFSYILTTVVLESMSQNALEDILSEIASGDTASV